MKKIYTIVTFLILLITSNSYAQLPAINFCDNFDFYVGGLPPFTPGDRIAETSPNWNSWDELMNGSVAPFIDDCEVSATEFYSAPNCLYVIDQTGMGGPQDILLMFDNTPNIATANIITLMTPYLSGVLTYSHMMKVVSGKTGYFNFQAENTPGIQWALEVNLDALGGMVMTNTSGTNFSASYPNGQWFEIKFVIDLKLSIADNILSLSILISSISSTIFFAASPRSLAEIIFSPDSSNIFFPSSEFVPASLTTSGISILVSFAASTMPWARTSHLIIPPKILIKIPLTFLSDKISFSAADTFSFDAPPPTSKKFAGV